MKIDSATGINMIVIDLQRFNPHKKWRKYKKTRQKRFKTFKKTKQGQFRSLTP